VLIARSRHDLTEKYLSTYLDPQLSPADLGSTWDVDRLERHFGELLIKNVRRRRAIVSDVLTQKLCCGYASGGRMSALLRMATNGMDHCRMDAMFEGGLHCLRFELTQRLQVSG